jgi:hypothetical protein
MYKHIENLMRISRPSDMDSSLPFTIANDNVERTIVWFHFYGKVVSGNKLEVNIPKIFLNRGQEIKTMEPNLHIVIDTDEYELSNRNHFKYIKEFLRQFEDKQFVDTMELLALSEVPAMLDVYEAVINYITTSRKMVCKHCGSDAGFYTKLSGVQYYTNTGEDDGYEVDVEGASVYCRKCKKRVCSVEQFRKGTI